MKRPWRTVAVVAVAAALLVIVRVGWDYAHTRFSQWIGVAHTTAGWNWRVYGLRRTGWHLVEIDSVRVANAKLHLRLRFLRLSWTREDIPYPLPVTLAVAARSLDLAVRPSANPDTAAPALPAWLRLPLRIEADLDSLRLRTPDGADSGRILLSIQGIELASTSPFSARATVRRLEPGKVPVRVGTTADLDWTSKDTVRVRLAALGASGCCAQDSLHLDAAANRRDLRQGRLHLEATVESSRGWSDVVPALAKAPGLHQIAIDARARHDRANTSASVDLSFEADSIVFFPKMRHDLSIRVDSSRLEVELDARDANQAGLHASLLAPLSRKIPLPNAVAAGEIRIDGLGWQLRGFEHPLDGTIQVLALDRKGAAVEVRTDAGSRIDGTASWKGLRWNLAGQVSPREPWAVGWVNGLALEQGGSVQGHDSAGGAFFRVRARQPRMTATVALDSLATDLWIGPGPRLVFRGIEARQADGTWVGSGDISVPDSVVRFELRPLTDSVSLANLEARFDGRVRIGARAFPTAGLPLRLPFRMPFDGRVDGFLHRDPPSGTEKSVSRVEATLRAHPRLDSLRLDVELAIYDSAVHLPRIGLEVGGSRLDGGLYASVGERGWEIDTLRMGTAAFDLAGTAGLWPGIPSLKGSLEGQFLSRRGDGVFAEARLDAPEIAGSDKSIQLPDLLLWSARDTVHLGGWIPLGGSRSPFHLSATHLWDPTPTFALKAFWGDLIKLEANGSFRDKKELATSFRLVGSTQIPGTEAQLRDLLVSGRVGGTLGKDGFVWNAKARGQRGFLDALAGNPLDLRFDVSADASAVRLDSLTLGGPKNGRLVVAGDWNIATKALSLTGQARKLHLPLGPDRWLDLDSLGAWATPDSRVRLQARDVFWHQTLGKPEERLDLGLSHASLTLVQAKDWKKLSGDVTVDKLLFTKNFAEVKDLIQMISGMGRKKKYAGGSAGIPLLLDIQATSDGDDLRLANNLGQAKLGFDLQVTGPTEAPLLNGFVAADPDSGRFGYLGRNFAIDTLRVDWNTSPVLKGGFSLVGSRQVRQTCDDAQKTTTTAAIEIETCSLVLSSQGSLENPRLRGLAAKDCPLDPSDDGTMGAFVALATDCYPQPNSKSDTRWGSVVKDGSIDLAYGYGMGWFNQMLMDRLRSSRQDAIWLPDSIMLTDVPVGGVRDQLGMSALYHMTPELDVAGVYRHTFTQAGSSASGSPVLADDYGLSLKYRIPFWWIEEERVRKRLTNRVFLQADLNQGLDENSRRTFSVLPSLRYRWEFW